MKPTYEYLEIMNNQLSTELLKAREDISNYTALCSSMISMSEKNDVHLIDAKSLRFYKKAMFYVLGFFMGYVFAFVTAPLVLSLVRYFVEK